MLDVGLSPDTAGPQVVDSFRACLSSILEIPLGEVPQHAENLRAAVAQWRTWLAGRGMGLVQIANASRFQWPGYWIAVAETPESKEQTAVLMFGSPSGAVLSPQNSALLG